MKSLQEIWDKFAGLEMQATQLAAQNTQLQKQLALLAASTVNFAWNLSTVVSGANRRNITLAFGQDAQPAVAYQNVTNADLAIARFNGASWAVSTVDGSGSNGGYTSLAFGPDGQPLLAYFSGTSAADLRFARYNNSG